MVEGLLWFVAGLSVQFFMKSRPVQQLHYWRGVLRAKRKIKAKRPTKKLLADGSIQSI